MKRHDLVVALDRLKVESETSGLDVAAILINFVARAIEMDAEIEVVGTLDWAIRKANENLRKWAKSN